MYRIVDRGFPVEGEFDVKNLEAKIDRLGYCGCAVHGDDGVTMRCVLLNQEVSMLVSTLFAQWDVAVRRGYRLHITNLEDRAFTYTIRYWVTPPNGEPRWAASMNQFFNLFYSGPFGNPDELSLPVFRRTGSIYVAAYTFKLEANHTVSVGITPGSSPPPNIGTNVMEGYVTLEVPVLRNGQGDSPFRPLPQAGGPVKVLLNPETAMIHADTSGAGYTRNLDGVTTGRVSVTRLNFDTVEPLIVASGKAENEIMPNGIVLLGRDALVEAVKQIPVAEGGHSGSLEGMSALPAGDRMAALIELLCGLDTGEDFVGELNKVLSKNQAGAKICRHRD